MAYCATHFKVGHTIWIVHPECKMAEIGMKIMMNANEEHFIAMCTGKKQLAVKLGDKLSSMTCSKNGQNSKEQP